MVKIRSHTESPLVELADGSQWQIFPGDLDVTLGWNPETGLTILEAPARELGTHFLVSDVGPVRVIPAGENWPVREVKEVLKDG
jgi:hypothetical protein